MTTPRRMSPERRRAHLVATAPELLLAVRGWIAVAETTCVTWLHDTPMPRERFRAGLADELVAMLGVSAAHGAR